jgi:GTP-binding protein Era
MAAQTEGANVVEPVLGAPPGFRSGFVAIIGRPNVGKSLLLNRFCHKKIAIISDKPQTTRNRITGVAHLPDAQVVFIDTPGIHDPPKLLNEYMVRVATGTLKEVDVVLWVMDASEPLAADDERILALLGEVTTPVLAVLNKIDLLGTKEALLGLIDQVKDLRPFAEIVPISALKGDNVESLLEALPRYLEEGPQYFPSDMVTDQPEPFIIAEFIREKVTNLTHQEIPYATAVVVDDMEWEEDQSLLRVEAIIYVERESQKGIVIGKGGAMLKRIGQAAREDLEGLFGAKLYLKLWVKVRKNWSKDRAALHRLGYR